MKKIFLLIGCWITLQASAQSWQQELRYRIDVSLNEKDKGLEGYFKLLYINHSPDTLSYIWMQLSPNAYRNDRTAYSEDLLNSNRTDFYFSDKEQKGYTNQLNFRVNGNIVMLEDHPVYQDVEKLVLNHPLAPGDSIRIETSFHEKLPGNFSGFGFGNNSFQLTDWYPEPSKYDANGWHPETFTASKGIPHEGGSFDIFISFPIKYTLIATGIYQPDADSVSGAIKTLHYEASSANAFAWMAYMNSPVRIPAKKNSFTKQKIKLQQPDVKAVHRKADGKWVIMNFNSQPVNPFGNLSFGAKNADKEVVNYHGKKTPFPIVSVPKPGSPWHLAPIAGYNRYDQLMIGAALSNFSGQPKPFEFTLAPIYGTNSTTLNGFVRLKYTWTSAGFFREFTAGLNASAFSDEAATDSTGKKIFARYYRIKPYLRATLPQDLAHPKMERWFELSSYLIGEKDFDAFAVSKTDSLIHPNAFDRQFRYLNQLSFTIRDGRILYPYDANIEFQQTSDFYRINVTAHYLVNYAGGGGLNLRFFGAKFGVWNKSKPFDASRYEPKLLGVNGEEDYTYDNYFLGRTASTAIENASVSNGGIAAQQIMIRDGGLKLRLDQYDYIQGRSANWVLALNLSSSLPQKLFPVQIPLKVFFDVGTYAEAWQSNASTSRFLYTGGLQLALFKNVLNIYAPLVYSSDFRSLLRSTSFGKKITFSIDLQNISERQTRKILFP